MSLLDRFRDNKELKDENSRIKRGKKMVEKDYNELLDKYNSRNDDYIALLEEKGEGFNRYLHYYDLYAEAYDTLKENKKEMSEYRSEIKGLKDSFAVYCSKIISYLPTLSKCNNDDKFFLVLESLWYAKSDIDTEELTTVCKKLRITKSMILNEYPDIYNDFKIADLDIEE